MTIIESYKDLFLNPRDFAKDKLKHGLKWWKYALIALGLNILIGFMQILSEEMQPEVQTSRMAAVTVEASTERVPEVLHITFLALAGLFATMLLFAFIPPLFKQG